MFRKKGKSMKKITINEFFKSSKKLAVHPGTYENANALCKAFDKANYVWWSGIKYIGHNGYEYYKDKTCYTNKGTYCDINLCKTFGYKIIEFKDIDLK